MTLLFPFVDQPITPQNLAPLSQTLSKLPSFDVTLSTIDYFVHSPQSCTIVLRPQSASSDVTLGDLQSACVTAFPLCTHQSSRAGGFTPHITLGQAKSRAQAESMVEQWRAKGLLDPILGVTFQVSGVDWIRRDGKDSDFYVVTTVNVGTT
jgi:2'-5' RNA ligase